MVSMMHSMVENRLFCCPGYDGSPGDDGSPPDCQRKMIM